MMIRIWDNNEGVKEVEENCRVFKGEVIEEGRKKKRVREESDVGKKGR